MIKQSLVTLEISAQDYNSVAERYTPGHTEQGSYCYDRLHGTQPDTV